MVERLDPDNLGVSDGNQGDVEGYIESDFRRRSGLCPNGHGLMVSDNGGQRCPSCGFSCNTPAELTSQ